MNRLISQSMTSIREWREGTDDDIVYMSDIYTVKVVFLVFL